MSTRLWKPGTPVVVCPPHEESSGWLAILAGWRDDNVAVVVPCEGHFGSLAPRSIDCSRGAYGPHLALAAEKVAAEHGEAVNVALGIAACFAL